MHVAQGVGVQNNDGHVPALASSRKLVLLLLLYLLVVPSHRTWASPSASSFCTVLLGLETLPAGSRHHHLEVDTFNPCLPPEFYTCYLHPL